MTARRTAVGNALRETYKPPETPLFVTHDELNERLGHIETKIENSQLRTRLWVLSGCIAIILSTGGSYMSIMSKLDSIAETNSTVEQRRPWMLRQDQRDDQQDQVLKRVAPEYTPLPYVEPPK